MYLKDLIEDNGTKFVVDARKLHEALGYKTRFGNWVEQYLTRSKYGFVENIDFVSGKKNITIEGTNLSRERTDYILSLRCASHVSMMANVDKGIEVRDYFYSLEEKLVNKERELAELKINNIKAVTMIFTHRDKLNMTKTQLYPILEKLGVEPKKKHRVHDMIKRALVGKYENIKLTTEFNPEEFVADYKRLAEQTKEEYNNYFVDDNQCDIFELLEDK